MWKENVDVKVKLKIKKSSVKKEKKKNYKLWLKWLLIKMKVNERLLREWY